MKMQEENGKPGGTEQESEVLLHHPHQGSFGQGKLWHSGFPRCVIILDNSWIWRQQKVQAWKILENL